ncbi:hypothetical protein C8A03DRAFT_32637 [Achaetomium macrosporum]|uniref:Uncharacterized protein n=1 Tax=Achaetomium macrosporum TaxID=79813 RepID=A0AAN7HGA1_9PEZI|nr:hypothetical protein C8A03DRAFT_32637 [Achaetomium macrosporum]
MGFKFGELTREITKVSPVHHIVKTGTQIANTAIKAIEEVPSVGNEIANTGSKLGEKISATGNCIGNTISDGIRKLPGAKLDEKLNSKNTNAFASSVGDLLFPDNPKLRHRAEQLEIDCRFFEAHFTWAKKDLNRLEDRARGAIDKFLKGRGFDSLDCLDREARRVAMGKVFEEWERLKANIGRDLAIENVIETICGIAALGGATVTGVLVAVGFISGPAGWSVLGAIGTATVIIGGVVFVGARRVWTREDPFQNKAADEPITDPNEAAVAALMSRDENAVPEGKDHSGNQDQTQHLNQPRTTNIFLRQGESALASEPKGINIDLAEPFERRESSSKHSPALVGDAIGDAAPESDPEISRLAKRARRDSRTLLIRPDDNVKEQHRKMRANLDLCDPAIEEDENPDDKKEPRQAVEDGFDRPTEVAPMPLVDKISQHKDHEPVPRDATDQDNDIEAERGDDYDVENYAEFEDDDDDMEAPARDTVGNEELLVAEDKLR